jgi:pimeloyl-ACP methyl ester carboxylesterase
MLLAEKCVKYYAKNAYSLQELARCKQNLEAFSHYYKNYLREFNYLNDVKKIQCPTLLMAGMLSPLHLPIRAQEMMEHMNSSLVRMHLFKQAGAPVYKDSPQEAAQVVRSFLYTLIGES